MTRAKADRGPAIVGNFQLSSNLDPACCVGSAGIARQRLLPFCPMDHPDSVSYTHLRAHETEADL
eukprot:3625037-Amphidinium_carterae.1